MGGGLCPCHKPPGVRACSASALASQKGGQEDQGEVKERGEPSFRLFPGLPGNPSSYPHLEACSKPYRGFKPLQTRRVEVCGRVLLSDVLLNEFLLDLFYACVLIAIMCSLWGSQHKCLPNNPNYIKLPLDPTFLVYDLFTQVPSIRFVGTR